MHRCNALYSFALKKQREEHPESRKSRVKFIIMAKLTLQGTQTHTGLLMDSRKQWGVSKRGGGDVSSISNEPCLKDGKDCCLRVLLPNTLLWWITMISLNALLSLAAAHSQIQLLNLASLQVCFHIVYTLCEVMSHAVCLREVQLCSTQSAMLSKNNRIIMAISLDSRIKEMSLFAIRSPGLWKTLA